MKTFYQTDENGVLLYAGQTIALPFGAVESEPPEVVAGAVARWDTPLSRSDPKYGHDDSGAWAVDTDHRATLLYRTSGGEKYEVGTAIAQGSYNGIGSIPDWLTTKERPDQFHRWSGNEWLLDDVALRQAQADMERVWRDGEINRVTWLRERHRDELDADMQTTLSKTKFSELLRYIQSLREWTLHDEFPNSTYRPVPPDFIS